VGEILQQNNSQAFGLLFFLFKFNQPRIKLDENNTKAFLWGMMKTQKHTY
jgi:hypothetical protein